MFKNNFFSGACEFATYEILVMLFGTLLLGCILGYLIWGWQRRRAFFIHQQSEKYRRISNLRQVQITDLSLRIVSLREQLELTDSRASLSEYRLRKAHEDLESIRNQQSQLQEGVESQSPSHHDQSQMLKNHSAEEDEPTLADITQAMLLRKEAAAKESQEAVKNVSSADLSRESLELAGKVFERPVDVDDFTVILGIDQRMANVLHRNGITSWDKLAHSNIADVQEVIESSNLQHREYDPTTWAIQARMAMKGEWKKLKVYQESLISK